jgi:BirA family biotin operon repressor/biotin-[acetyl-CoA-carboxylase] ligase
MTGQDWFIRRYQTVASTMDVAASLAACGARERTVVVANEQSAGRGRGGRGWQSPAGGLYCTVIFRPDVDPSRLSTLPLLAAVAVAEAIEAMARCPTSLKWPNDIWLGDDPIWQKVAGILAASRVAAGRVDHVLLGVGVNLTGEVDALPPGATTVAAATGVLLTPEDLLAPLLERLEGAYAAFLRAGGHVSLDGWRARAALLGQSVVVTAAGRALAGRFVGIDDDGALLLQEEGAATRRIVAGDLVRGPSPIA